MSTGIEPLDRGPRPLVFTAESHSGKKSPVAVVISRLLTAARRYWFLLILGFLGTLVGTYFGSNALVKKTWESSTTILYTSLPITEVDRGLFTAPDLKTLSALVNSPGTIDAIREEFHLDVPTKVIDKSLTVVVPNGTKMINLTFKWEDGPACVAMLNRLAGLFISQVDELRRKKLGAHLKDFESSLQAVQARYDEATGKLQEIYRRENLIDHKSESIAATLEISQLEFILGQHRRSESDTLAKMERMDAHLKDVKDQETKEVELEKQFEATTETVADNRRRQDRLRELIGDERRIQQIQAALDAKLKEIARTRKLAARGIVSPADLEAAEAEIIGLKSQMEDNDRIHKLQEELEKIDKVVVPVGKNKKSGSPIIQQILFRKLELELELAGNRQEINQIDTQIKTRRAGLVRLESLKGDIERLTKKMDAIDAERIQIERQIGSLRNLQSLNVGELSVIAPAMPSEFPASSNKKILIMAFAGIGMLATLGLVAFADSLSRSRTPQSKARRLGLATLAEIPSASQFRHQQLRRLALRLRQYLPQPGSLVLFSSISESRQIESLIEELADCLALRDERVVILDTRIGERAHPDLSRSRLQESVLKPNTVLALSSDTQPQGQGRGLAEYLRYECNDIDDICNPTDGIGVDRITAGESDVAVDMLATHRMTQLVKELQLRYTMVLVIAPPLEHAVEMQILSALSQGVITIVDSPKTPRMNTLHSLNELRVLGAPLLGQIVCN